MNTKYLSREDRKKVKRQARQDRKAILLSLTRKERKEWKRGNKGLRAFAESIGKNQPKDWYDAEALRAKANAEANEAEPQS